MKRFITGNQAVAEAVKLCRPGVVAAYPITPQTPIYEALSDMEAAGTLGGIMMRVESEHSAMAACLSASLTGVRTFTASSSQGLALMHEMLHFAAGARAPVVMAGVNRSLALPWAFWSDQTDTLAQRDTGWMQIYCEDNQESADSIIQAFKAAEAVLLPCLVVLEANLISHFLEPVDLPDQEIVDRFLPPADLPRRFDPDCPAFVAGVVNPAQYRACRRLAQEAMGQALDVLTQVDEEFKHVFGRGYRLVEAEGVAGSDLTLVTTGTITATAREVRDKLRAEGLRIGIFKLRVFRPFPTALVRAALAGAGRLAVIERNISLGREGIFCSEVKAALTNASGPRWIQGYLAGIGGTDVGPELIERIARDALARPEPLDGPIWATEEGLSS